MAQTLAQAGMFVWVHANSQLAKAQALAAQINQDEAVHTAGGGAEALAFDVTDADACQAAVQQMLARAPVQVLVHNAASGYWAIATGATPPAQVLGGYDASFAVGLFEAMVQVQTLNTPVLLVVIDSEYPQPLHAKRPIADTSGLALVLSPNKSERSLAQLVLDPKAYLADGAAPVQLQPGLEGLSAMSEQLPPWRGVPLLAALADVEAGDSPVAVRLPWLPGQVLQLTVQKDQIHAQ